MVTTMYNKINYQRAHSHLNCHVTPPLEHNKGTDFVGVNRMLAAFTIIVLDVLCIAPNKESRFASVHPSSYGCIRKLLSMREALEWHEVKVECHPSFLNAKRLPKIIT